MTAGVYTKFTTEEDDASGYLMGGDASEFDGSFEMQNTAGYFQYEQELMPRFSLMLNIRIERSVIDYIG